MGFALKGVKTAAERNTGVCFHLPHFGGTAVRDHPECAAHITGVHHPLRRNVLPRGRQYEGAVLFEKLAQDLQAFSYAVITRPFLRTAERARLDVPRAPLVPARLVASFYHAHRPHTSFFDESAAVCVFLHFVCAAGTRTAYCLRRAAIVENLLSNYTILCWKIVRKILSFLQHYL